MGKKLIEVALPLKAINKAFVLEKQPFRREPDFRVTNDGQWRMQMQETILYCAGK